MNSKEVDVSVVVPLYNHERYIIDALESVFQQSVRPREVIVIDDGSRDRSFEIVKSEFGNQKNLVLWKKDNSGAHHTINSGIHRATSSNIAILNSDDIYEKERIQKCLEKFELHKDADIICTGISFIDGSGRNIRNKWYEQAYEFYLENGDYTISLINGNFLMTTSNIFVRRSAFERYGYFGKYRYAHDLAFLLRVLRYGGKINYYDAPLLRYRIHDSNTIDEGVLKVKVELAMVIAEHIIGLHQINGGMPDVNYMKALYGVLDKHNLSRMLFPAISLMAIEAIDAGGADNLLSKEEFLDFMLLIAR